MTIVQLASVSLFALVVTSRPILPSDADLTEFAPTPSTLQTSFQAVFRTYLGKDDLTSHATHVHFQKAKQEVGYLSELCAEDVPTITSFDTPSGVQPLLDASLDEIAKEQDGQNERDDDTDKLVGPETAVEVPTDDSSSAPLVVLVFSCVTAFLALVCIGLTLYVVKSLRSQVLGSKTAWELLPRFWRRSKSQENTSETTRERLADEGCHLLQTECFLDGEEGSAQRRGLHSGDKSLYSDPVSDIESEWDDVDEKYQDAVNMTPLPLIHDLPLEDNVSHPSHLEDPPLPPACPLDQPTVDHSTPMMRELCLSPVGRPAWSARAIGSPTLGLPSRQGGVDDVTLQPLIHPRRRAYRSPVPEFDIALAMQLRPGLGIGADSAWMVRFLMAIFGWFAIALTGNTR